MKQRFEYKSTDAAPGGKKKRKAISVKWLLLLALLMLTVASLVLIWVAQSVFLDRIYINIKKKVIHSVSETLQSLTVDELPDKVAELGKENDLCIAVYSVADGGDVSFIAGYDAKPSCNCMLHQLQLRQNYPKQDPAAPAIKGKTIAAFAAKTAECGGFCFLEAEEASSVLNKKITASGMPPDEAPDAAPPRADTPENLTAISTVKSGGATCVYFINSSVVPLASTIETINTMMIYLSGFVILSAVIFALIIALWITRPIEEINSSAKRLAECDYSVKFSGKGYREVDELSETLNYAAGELSKVDNLQKELIANISHDLRTPLTLIAGYAEMMRDLPDEKTEENLQIIIDESNRMKALVNDVLDISKLGSGTAELNLETLPLTNSVESELTRYNKLRDREGYIIEFEYHEQVTVLGDYTRLMQVVYNLVNNAVNYAGADKKVLVRQTVKDGRVRISVTDHGEGIPKEELPKIWDRYYKVDKTHRRATVGSGLGLSIVKGIISAHRGVYGVESEVGVGSTFYFELDAQSVTPLKESENKEPSE